MHIDSSEDESYDDHIVRRVCESYSFAFQNFQFPSPILHTKQPRLKLANLPEERTGEKNLPFPSHRSTNPSSLQKAAKPWELVYIYSYFLPGSEKPE